MSCTCEVKRVKVGVKKEDFFILHYCPMHKAAPALVEALEALGVTPYDYYCFCPPEMGFVSSGDHTGECREAQQALGLAQEGE